MGEFKYLAGVIPMILAEFLIILVVTLLVYNRQRLDLNKKFVNEKSLYKAFFYGQPVEYVYRSHFGSAKWNYVLLCTRLASLLFFLSIDCIWNYVKEDGFNYRYFTQWNIDWICVYFLLVTLASAIGLYYDHKLTQSITTNESITTSWSESIHVVSNATQVIFEVTGASAFFVTVVAFGLLNPKFQFWNVSEHFVTSLAILLELCLNSIPVRAEHVVFNVGWALLYLFYIWPAVTLNTVKAWPYDFLKTESPSSYVWYTILVVLNLIFYFVWYGVFRLKEKYLSSSVLTPPALDGGESTTLSGLEVVSQTSVRREGQLLLDKDVDSGLKGASGSAYAAVKGPMLRAEHDDIENSGL